MFSILAPSFFLLLGCLWCFMEPLHLIVKVMIEGNLLLIYQGLPEYLGEIVGEGLVIVQDSSMNPLPLIIPSHLRIFIILHFLKTYPPTFLNTSQNSP